MTNILGDVTQVPGDVTSGELTSGRSECNNLFQT